MKLNNLNLNFTFKKIKKEFDPNKHWYGLLFLIIVLLIIITIYSVYNFYYIKNEINSLELEAQNQIVSSTSSDFLEKTKKNNQLMRNINSLKDNLEKFNQKEIEYNRLLNTGNIVIEKASTTATTSVATSTKE